LRLFSFRSSDDDEFVWMMADGGVGQSGGVGAFKGRLYQAIHAVSETGVLRPTNGRVRQFADRF